MNKKIIPVLILFMLVAGLTWWLMKKNNATILGKKYDPELDSIFFDLTFGMSRKAFQDTCWNQNKKGLFIQGPNNLSVQHAIDSALGMRVFMNFYPNFSEKDQLYQMPVIYNYESWSPWNRHLFSDTLISRLAKKVEEDFDISLTRDTTEDGRPAYYNYTGPRKILLTTQDEQFVKVLIENERYK